ncbi:hypothetical protein BDZ89DRAFT_1140522 [Hymenopellis radicata]|nr:hypothetical protein BDZ89DRAFT_1140522 [Hymenopellis radicata]
MSATPKNTTDTKPLKRGKACLTCRFLKIKCDGAKPICGPCLRHPKDDECEYADSPRRSRTKQLEDQVARLEARLRDLEQPELPSPIILHNPYEDPAQAPTHAHGIPMLAPSTSDPPWTSTSSPYSSVLSPLVDTPPGAPGSSGRRTESPHYSSDEPAPHIARSFIEIFFRYAPELGFFLHTSNFYSSATLAPPLGHVKRPCSSVLTVIYLWGCHLSERSAEYQAWGDQRHLLNIALKHTALGLTSDHPERYMQTIQAEVLLSYYFLRIGNLLEARQHASGLYRSLWAADCTGFVPNSIGDEASMATLLPPVTTIEEGERIDGFWQVVILCKNLAVALDAPSEVCGPLEAPGFQIDTPWPLDKKQYEHHVLPPQSTSTVNAFLRQASQIDVSGSLLALTAQAAILLQQVTYFAGQWNAGRNTQNFPNTYQILNRLVVQLGHNLPSLHSSKSPSVFFVHAQVFAATIKLNEVAASSEFRARRDCVVAAHTMIHWAFSVLLAHRLLQTLLMIAIRALIDEVLRLRSSHALLEDSKDFTEEGIDATIRVGFQLLYFFSPESPFMRYQLTNIQASYHSLQN